MTSSNGYDMLGIGPSDLKGLGILLVEDSWQVGKAMKNLLELLGADVAGPAATTADAEHLLAGHVPDVALVDVNLRDGELAYGLIDRLHDQGVPIIVMTGYAVLPLSPTKTAVILQKPVSSAQLLAALRSLIAEKTAERDSPLQS
jgi:CheY-like chemotaxis protein